MFGVKGCLFFTSIFYTFPELYISFQNFQLLGQLSFRDYLDSETTSVIKNQMLCVSRSSFFFVYFSVVRIRSKDLDGFLLLSTRKRISNKLQNLTAKTISCKFSYEKKFMGQAFAKHKILKNLLVQLMFLSRHLDFRVSFLRGYEKHAANYSFV